MTPAPGSDPHALARQSRLAGLVMAVTGMAWVALQWLGGAMGWPVRFVFLFDLMAIAAFLWALAVTWRVWKRRRSGPQGPGATKG